MPTHELLSPVQRLRLTELPVDLDERLMARHHTLSEREIAAVKNAEVWRTASGLPCSLPC